MIERNRDGRATLVIGTSRDITQTKLAQAMPLEAQHRQNIALKSARLGQWNWVVRTNEFTLDARGAEIAGYAPRELGVDGNDWNARRNHPDNIPAIQASLKAYLRGETSNYSQEYRVIHKLGHIVWVHSTGLVIERDAKGAPMRMVGVSQDITARKQGEQTCSRRRISPTPRTARRASSSRT